MLSVCMLLPIIIDIAFIEYHMFEPLDCIIYHTQTYIIRMRLRWSLRTTAITTTMVTAITTAEIMGLFHSAL